MGARVSASGRFLYPWELGGFIGGDPVPELPVEPPPPTVNSGHLHTVDAVVDMSSLGKDVAAAATADVIRQLLGIAEVGNLLPESPTWTKVGATAAPSTEQTLNWPSSLKVTTTAASGHVATGLGTSGVPVRPGESYTAWLAAYASNDEMATQVALRFFDQAGVQVGTDVLSANEITYSSGMWANESATAVAPAGAVTAGVVVPFTGATVGDTAYLDWGMWRGAGGSWTPPGIPSSSTGVPIGTQAEMDAADGDFMRPAGSMRIITDHPNGYVLQMMIDGSWSEVLDYLAPHMAYSGAESSDPTGVDVGFQWAKWPIRQSIIGGTWPNTDSVLFWGRPSDGQTKWKMLSPDVRVSETEPYMPFKGTWWIKDSTSAVKVWSGTKWITVS